MSNRSKDYILISILCIASSFVIFGNSLTASHGFLSPDSTEYLRLAQRLLDGYPFTVPNGGRGVAQDSYSATWPIGYSAIIALTSYIFSISVFIASKAINLLMLITLILILYRKFGWDGLIVSTTLLSASTIEIFSMTWSEAPFIFFIFILCIHIGSLLSDEKEIGKASLSYLLILLICVFLMRYIGVFAIAATFVVALIIYLRGRYRDAAKIFFISVSALLFSTAYLGLNKYLSGYTTGMKRIPAPEGIVELLRALSITVVRELVLPVHYWALPLNKAILVVAVFLISLTFILFKISKATRNKVGPTVRDRSFIFCFFGLVYLLAITVSRFTTQFDDFSFRLVNPAFSLIFAGIIIYFMSAYRELKVEISYFLIFVMSLSVASYSYRIIKHINDPGYFMADQERRARYAGIPDGAIVLFGDIHLAYLRASVHLSYPRFTPYSSIDEPIDEFLQAVDTSRPIYLEVGDRALWPNRYHPSVQRWVRGFSEGTMIEIDDLQTRTDADTD